MCWRDDQKGRRSCRTCRNRRFKEDNPLSATYSQLKQNARKRGIGFSVTHRGWKAFCNRTGYLKLRGPDGESMTVDRKKYWLGYTNKNIRPLTRIENTQKEHVDKAHALKQFVSVRDPDEPF